MGSESEGFEVVRTDAGVMTGAMALREFRADDRTETALVVADESSVVVVVVVVLMSGEAVTVFVVSGSVNDGSETVNAVVRPKTAV